MYRICSICAILIRIHFSDSLWHRYCMFEGQLQLTKRCLDTLSPARLEILVTAVAMYFLGCWEYYGVSFISLFICIGEFSVFRDIW